jgi:hypothetical protein
MMRVRLIGYWASCWSSVDGPDWPDPRDFIDVTWSDQERNLVASYLEQGDVPWAQAGLSTCRLCGKPNGSAELTDGVFLWPEGLAHYVRDHSVRLPDEVISHMTQQRLAEAVASPRLIHHSVDKDWWRSQRRFRDPGPPPTQADLDAVVSGATSAVVRSVPAPNVWYETQDPADLDSLRDALRVGDGEMSHCVCHGTALFEFGRDGERLGIVTLHHGKSLRWDPFFFNAPLAESDRILDWLTARGMTELIREREGMPLPSSARERWHAALPHALDSRWPSMSQSAGQVTWPEEAELMARAYADPVERARILLEWFGHGEGPWSGYPVYEDVPEWCLLQLPLDVILDAAQTRPQTSSLREGTARLFAGLHFATQRRADLKRIPTELKRTLLEHAVASQDENKRRRAQHAFKPN